MKYMSLACSIMIVAGCATSFDRAKQAASEAPDWYDSAKKEIVGEGYPNLGTMPALSADELEGSNQSIVLSREDMADAQTLFSTHPRATTPVTTEIEVRALKAELVAKLARSGPGPSGVDSDLFLKPADVERLREIFKRAEQR